MKQTFSYYLTNIVSQNIKTLPKVSLTHRNFWLNGFKQQLLQSKSLQVSTIKLTLVNVARIWCQIDGTATND